MRRNERHVYCYYSKVNYENYHLMTSFLQNFDMNLKRVMGWIWWVLAQVRTCFGFQSLWKSSTPKHETTYKDYKDGGLKDVHISEGSVNYSTLGSEKRLYNDCFHESKLIPLHLMIISFESKCKFQPNIYLKKLLPLYKDIFITLWQKLEIQII